MADCRCCCSWPECHTLHTSINHLAPADHPWGQDIIRVTFNNRDIDTVTPSKLAQWHSINHHLIASKTPSTIPKNFCIRCHHFLISLLKWQKYNPKIGYSTSLVL